MKVNFKLVACGLILLTVLVSGSTTNKNLRLILKDGHFAKLPQTAKNIRATVVQTSNLRHGFLSFESSTNDIKDWLNNSKLQLTNKEEVFVKNILVNPNERPIWFDRLTHSVLAP